MATFLNIVPGIEDKEVQDDLENEILKIVQNSSSTQQVQFSEAPIATEPEESIFRVLESAERRRQEQHTHLYVRDNSSAQVYVAEDNARPAPRCRRVGMDLGTPVVESNFWRSNISTQQREQMRTIKRQQQMLVDEDAVSSLDNESTKLKDVCKDGSSDNGHEALNQPTSRSSSESSLEVIILEDEDLKAADSHILLEEFEAKVKTAVLKKLQEENGFKPQEKDSQRAPSRLWSAVTAKKNKSSKNKSAKKSSQVSAGSVDPPSSGRWFRRHKEHKETQRPPSRVRPVTAKKKKGRKNDVAPTIEVEQPTSESRLFGSGRDNKQPSDELSNELTDGGSSRHANRPKGAYPRSRIRRKLDAVVSVFRSKLFVSTTEDDNESNVISDAEVDINAHMVQPLTSQSPEVIDTVQAFWTDRAYYSQENSQRRQPESPPEPEPLEKRNGRLSRLGFFNRKKV